MVQKGRVFRNHVWLPGGLSLGSTGGAHAKLLVRKPRFPAVACILWTTGSHGI